MIKEAKEAWKRTQKVVPRPKSQKNIKTTLSIHMLRYCLFIVRLLDLQLLITVQYVLIDPLRNSLQMLILICCICNNLTTTNVI